MTCAMSTMALAQAQGLDPWAALMCPLEVLIDGVLVQLDEAEVEVRVDVRPELGVLLITQRQ